MRFNTPEKLRNMFVVTGYSLKKCAKGVELWTLVQAFDWEEVKRFAMQGRADQLRLQPWYTADSGKYGEQ